MLIAVAVLGWVLFALTAILYWVGLRKDSEESNALAVFCLVNVLSDVARETSQSLCDQVFEKHGVKLGPKEAIYGAMQGITEGARITYPENLDILLSEVHKRYFSRSTDGP
jgi:hypothetical protein